MLSIVKVSKMLFNSSLSTFAEEDEEHGGDSRDEPDEDAAVDTEKGGDVQPPFSIPSAHIDDWSSAVGTVESFEFVSASADRRQVTSVSVLGLDMVSCNAPSKHSKQ